jgi:hypothetical protein
MASLLIVVCNSQSVDPGDWKPADEDTLKKRRIIKVRRGGAALEPVPEDAPAAAAAEGDKAASDKPAAAAAAAASTNPFGGVSLTAPAPAANPFAGVSLAAGAASKPFAGVSFSFNKVSWTRDALIPCLRAGPACSQQAGRVLPCQHTVSVHSTLFEIQPHTLTMSTTVLIMAAPSACAGGGQGS